MVGQIVPTQPIAMKLVNKNPKMASKLERLVPQNLRSLRKALKKMCCRLQRENMASLILNKT